ncbi:MAG: SurA N-terminal domain-containing protein, partial [Anaerolineae bacterium]|nr:SurA N-terminal domain-containing protein [Anaerolineae bacterium]
MAKTNKPVKNLTKKQLSRRRREEQQLLWVWVSVAAVAVIVLIIIGIGVVSQLTRTVAIVNGERIKATEYEKRVRFYYYSLGPDLFEDEQGNPSTETHQQIVDLLIDEALVRQEAAKRNITATEEEIEIAVEENYFQYYRDPPTPTPSPTVDPQATATPEATPTAEGATPAPTATSTPTYEEQYDMFVDNVLRPARVSEAYIRD